MSGRDLVVHQGSLSTMETALAQATTDITRQIDELLDATERLTPGWEASSDSHAAHLAYQLKLRDGVQRLTQALDQVKTKLATYREQAREIELENVAIVN